MEADGGSGGGGSGGSGRGHRSSDRSSQERKRPAGPAAEEGEEGEVRRRVRPREVPAEAGEAWAEQLDLDKAASFRETTRGPAAPARWRQAESRALQQLRLVAPPAATAAPPAATAAACRSRHGRSDPRTLMTRVVAGGVQREHLGAQ